MRPVWVEPGIAPEVTLGATSGLDSSSEKEWMDSDEARRKNGMEEGVRRLDGIGPRILPEVTGSSGELAES